MRSVNRKYVYVYIYPARIALSTLYKLNYLNLLIISILQTMKLRHRTKLVISFWVQGIKIVIIINNNNKFIMDKRKMVREDGLVRV